MKAAIGVAAVIGGMLALPGAAAAGPINDLLNDVGNGVNQTLNGLLGNGGGGNGGGGNGGGGDPAPAPQPAPDPGQSVDPAQEAQPTPQQGTEPPIDGTNPHGQGTVLEAETPLGPVVVGETRGEQDEDGNYSGRVTLISLLGQDVLPLETEEGETEESPLTPVNEGILNDFCTATQICLTALDYRSQTTENGSENSFSVLNAEVLDLAEAGVVESEGNISDDGECQTSSGSSSAESLSLGGGAITSDGFQSSSRSMACNDGSEDVERDSEVLNVATIAPLDLLVGCDPVAEDSEWELGVAGVNVAEGVCNADDTNAGQTDTPYNVRQAFSLVALPLLDALAPDLAGLATLVAGASESHAQAPGDGPTPPPNGPPPPPPPGPPEGPDGPPDGPPADGPGAPGDGPTAEPRDDDELPFTGSDMMMLALIGFGVMGTGLGGMALADRRRRIRDE